MHTHTHLPHACALQAALIAASGREVTWEALQGGMPYTDACVREATRLVPSAVCCGVVWCGVVWCGVVWCGVAGHLHLL